MHVDFARLGRVPLHVTHAGERLRFGVGGVERETSKQ
jgi:hypothetical protein